MQCLWFHTGHKKQQAAFCILNDNIVFYADIHTKKKSWNERLGVLRVETLEIIFRHQDGCVLVWKCRKSETHQADFGGLCRVSSKAHNTIHRYLPLNPNKDNPNSRSVPSPACGNRTPISHVLICSLVQVAWFKGFLLGISFFELNRTTCTKMHTQGPKWKHRT